MLRPPPTSTLFPYTTLFRSSYGCARPFRRYPCDRPGSTRRRSEEHTSELQSRFDLVCRLLLEKKNGRHDGGYYTVKDCVTIDVLPRTPGNNVYVGFMVWSNFTATKCRGLVSLNQVIKEIICLQPLK